MDMPVQQIAIENDSCDWRKTKNKGGDSFAPRERGRSPFHAARRADSTKRKNHARRRTELIDQALLLRSRTRMHH
jgi:hypothetical protein